MLHILFQRRCFSISYEVNKTQSKTQDLYNTRIRPLQMIVGHLECRKFQKILNVCTDSSFQHSILLTLRTIFSRRRRMKKFMAFGPFSGLLEIRVASGEWVGGKSAEFISYKVSSTASALCPLPFLSSARLQISTFLGTTPEWSVQLTNSWSLSLSGV